MKPANLNLVNIRQGETATVPWDDRRVTFIFVSGNEICTDHTHSGKMIILDKIKIGDILLAAWTGQWTTDIFQLDIKWLKRTEQYKYHRKQIREEAKKQAEH
ncbi:MAG: hypothetical protein C4542_05350 [Dehalococcoidia bacterium]|nr:MAG: hypothetical protein C4542_05350 [Dehalococcoidia bacterium]